jgi:hypothetical protein
MVIIFVATGVVVWRRAGDTRDKPDAVTEARMEERATGTS